MKSSPRNVPASVRARLTNLAKAEHWSVDGVFRRYLQERLLYRLSCSKYCGVFVLKGGLLLYGAHRLGHRLTVDVDLLGRGIASDADHLALMFREIAAIQVDDDGVVFSPDSVRVSEIAAQTEYGGLRVEIEGRLEQARMTLQIDIGFGDVVVPHPIEIEFPSLLDSPPAILLAYSLESVIAEKFDAMLRLAQANSRMKDFFDIYTLSTQRTFDGRTLQEAIHETLNRRATPVERDAHVFNPQFGQDHTMQQRWTAFRRRLRVESESVPGFSEVADRLRRFLEPLFDAICHEEEFFGTWDHASGQWVSANRSQDAVLQSEGSS